MDDQMISLPLPRQLEHPFFFSKKTVKVDKQCLPGCSSNNFMYEVLFYNGVEGFKPWLHDEETIQQLLKEWETLKKELEELFKRRDHENTLNPMKKGIGLFIEFLFWSNGLPVSLVKPIPSFQTGIKPINVEERLAFIISRPGLFPSFRQLTELMIEQEKMYVTKNIIKKGV